MIEVEQNKKIVVDYYQTAFNGNPEKAVADHFGDRYIQHNPQAANGAGSVRRIRKMASRPISGTQAAYTARHRRG
ncbi:nuclear transport factor 2 family protein [Caballeronia sordidicola]|uniref:nuclear transport factor 2 family protein n=1 Tax=Caballeronia sordidicola TaxID=196367 RepID=UPI00211B2E08|nr:hypothetical protein [Caballeronia sordidicola]